MRLPSWRAVAAMTMLVSVTGMWWPARAAAHAELVSSSPPANASLAASPAEVSLVFSEQIDGRNPSVRLTNEAGAAVSIGAPVLDPPGTSLTARLPDLEPALYTVSYQVTSALDGHVTRGLFAFLVDPEGTRAPPELITETATNPPDLGTSLARWAALALGLALLGTVIFWVNSTRPPRGRRFGPDEAPAAPWLALLMMAVGSLIGLGVFLALAAAASIDPSGIRGSPSSAVGLVLDFAAPFGDTPFANAMRVTQAGLVIAAIAASLGLASSVGRGSERSVRRREAGALICVGVGAAVALAGWSLGSHAAALGGAAFAALDWLHLVAVAAWLGALPGVLLLLARGRRRSDGSSMAPDALIRHSRVALAAAPLVLLSGIANSSLVLGEARNLVSTDYGNQLLAKAVLFSAALGLGAANFFLVRARSWRRMARVGLAELGVGAAAVLVAALLVSGQPAAGRPLVVIPPAGGATQLSGIAGASQVHLAVIVAAPGEQRYQLSVRDSATGLYRTDVQRAFLRFDPPPAADLPPLRVSLAATDLPWLWTASGAYTPVVGEWQVEVTVRRFGVLDESTGLALPVVDAAPATIVPQTSSGIQAPAALTWAWGLLPDGASGWLPAGIALAALTTLFAVERTRSGSDLLRAARAGLAVAVVLLGLLTGSRDLVAAADVAPPAAATQANPVPATAASVARGARIYRANCAACHATDGGDLAAAVGAEADGALAWRVAVGTAATRMPGFASTLSSIDRWDLVNYLRTLTGD